MFMSNQYEKNRIRLINSTWKDNIPRRTIIQESLACISYFIYNDKKGNDWKEFPELEKFINDENLKEMIA